MVPKEYTLKLTDVQVTYILAVLQKKPIDEAFNTFNAVQTQMLDQNPQLKAQVDEALAE